MEPAVVALKVLRHKVHPLVVREVVIREDYLEAVHHAQRAVREAVVAVHAAQGVGGVVRHHRVRELERLIDHLPGVGVDGGELSLYLVRGLCHGRVGVGKVWPALAYEAQALRELALYRGARAVRGARRGVVNTAGGVGRGGAPGRGRPRG